MPHFDYDLCMIDLTGLRFGRWLVLAKVPIIWGSRSGLPPMWECLCDCGARKAVDGAALRKSKSRSCGCLKLDMQTTHGLYKRPEYKIWMAMKTRCGNPHYAQYKDYGGRGIVVCKEWVNSFDTFLKDMGRRPSSQHQIDRIDNNGNYCKENCRWATRREQVLNKSNRRTAIFNGARILISDLAARFSVNAQSLHEKLSTGIGLADRKSVV